jgi:hypothetical protein
MELDDLKCCGNCKYRDAEEYNINDKEYIIEVCTHAKSIDKRSWKVCDEWEGDTYIHEERMDGWVVCEYRENNQCVKKKFKI